MQSGNDDFQMLNCFFKIHFSDDFFYGGGGWKKLKGFYSLSLNIRLLFNLSSSATQNDLKHSQDKKASLQKKKSSSKWNIFFEEWWNRSRPYIDDRFFNVWTSKILKVI